MFNFSFGQSFKQGFMHGLFNSNPFMFNGFNPFCNFNFMPFNASIFNAPMSFFSMPQMNFTPNFNSFIKFTPFTPFTPFNFSQFSTTNPSFNYNFDTFQRTSDNKPKNSSSSNTSNSSSSSSNTRTQSESSKPSSSSTSTRTQSESSKPSSSSTSTRTQSENSKPSSSSTSTRTQSESSKPSSSSTSTRTQSESSKPSSSSTSARTQSESSKPSSSSTSTRTQSENHLSELMKKRWYEMTDAEMRQVYGNYETDITKLYKGTAEQLNKYLKGKGKLYGMGETFMQAQKKYGINAAVLMSIAAHESNEGKSDNALKKNNVGGVRIPGKKTFKTYNSVQECIMDMARFLKNTYVDKYHLIKLYQINARYCPSAEVDKNSNWASGVTRHLKKFENFT